MVSQQVGNLYIAVRDQHESAVLKAGHLNSTTIDICFKYIVGRETFYGDETYNKKIIAAQILIAI